MFGNKLRRCAALALCTGMALFLLACASQGVDEMDFKSAGKAHLTIAWWGGESRHVYTRELLERYTKLHPNITFEANPAEWDGYFDNLAMQAAAGSMPDILQMDYMYLSAFTQNGSLTDLTSFIQSGPLDISDVEEELIDSGTIGGKLTGIPIASLTLTVGCSRDIFKEAGMELPSDGWTWEDFVQTCKTITERTGKYGLGIILADDIMPFHYYVRQQGKSMFREDNRALGYQDDKIFADFAEMMKELADAGAMPGPDQYSAVQALGYEKSLVAEGKAAMALEWSNYGSRLETVNPDIALVLPPGAKDTGALWMKPSMFFSVADTSANKEEAARFIQWLLHSKGANGVMSAERGIPVSKEIRDYLPDSGFLSETQKEMFAYHDKAIAQCGATPDPDPVGTSEINEVFREEIYSVLYGQKEPLEAAVSFRERAETILKKKN